MKKKRSGKNKIKYIIALRSENFVNVLEASSLKRK